MMRVATIAIAVFLLVGSCVTPPLETEQTTRITETSESTSELRVTITPSTATWTPRPPTPTIPVDTVVPASPTPTTKTIGEQVTLDCSPAFHLIKLGVSDKPQAPIDVAVYDKFAYVLDHEGMWVMDISDPTKPFDVGFIPMAETKQVVVDGGFAYGIDARGLWVLDLQNPTAPELIGFKDTPFRSLELSIINEFAYVRDEHGILRIFDLAKPTSITEVGVYDPPGQILGQEIVGNQIFVLRGLANENPLPSFSMSGEYIYLADLDGGLRVIDISDPTRPTEIGSTALQISDVEVVGDQAYLFEVVVGQNIHLWVLSISTPTALDDPTHLGMLQLWWWNMTSSDLCSFISEIYSLLLESEESLPGESEVHLKDFLVQLKGIDVVGDTIYVADEEEGLVIFQMTAAGD